MTKKLEITDEAEYRIFAETEDAEYTGEYVSFGKKAHIEIEGRRQWALIDKNCECDGLLHDTDTGAVEPVGFEFGCEREDEDGEDDEPKT